MAPNRWRLDRWLGPGRAADQIAPGVSGLEQLQAMIAAGGRPPIGDILEFSLTEAGDGWATFEGLPGRHAYNPIGTVHGGDAIIKALMGRQVPPSNEEVVAANRAMTAGD